MTADAQGVNEVPGEAVGVTDRDQILPIALIIAVVVVSKSRFRRNAGSAARVTFTALEQPHFGILLQHGNAVAV